MKNIEKVVWSCYGIYVIIILYIVFFNPLQIIDLITKLFNNFPILNYLDNNGFIILMLIGIFTYLPLMIYIFLYPDKITNET